MPETIGCFLVVTGKEPNLTALTGLVVTAVVGVLPLLVSNAGKSSDCRAGCEAWEAIIFESPLLEANCCTSCFACDVSLSNVEFRTMCVGVEETDILESGVVARG
jgi:hypothetical protein